MEKPNKMRIISKEYGDIIAYDAGEIEAYYNPLLAEKEKEIGRLRNMIKRTLEVFEEHGMAKNWLFKELEQALKGGDDE